MVRLDRSC